MKGEYVVNNFDGHPEAREAFPHRYWKSISNHCPVSLRIIDQDNDDPSIDWGR